MSTQQTNKPNHKDDNFVFKARQPADKKKASLFRRYFTTWMNGDFNGIPLGIHATTRLYKALNKSWANTYFISMLFEGPKLLVNSFRLPIANLFAYLYLPVEGLNFIMDDDGLHWAVRPFVASSITKQYSQAAEIANPIIRTAAYIGLTALLIPASIAKGLLFVPMAITTTILNAIGFINTAIFNVFIEITHKLAKMLGKQAPESPLLSLNLIKDQHSWSTQHKKAQFTAKPALSIALIQENSEAATANNSKDNSPTTSYHAPVSKDFHVGNNHYSLQHHAEPLNFKQSVLTTTATPSPADETDTESEGEGETIHPRI